MLENFNKESIVFQNFCIEISECKNEKKNQITNEIIENTNIFLVRNVTLLRDITTHAVAIKNQIKTKKFELCCFLKS